MRPGRRRPACRTQGTRQLCRPATSPCAPTASLGNDLSQPMSPHGARWLAARTASGNGGRGKRISSGRRDGKCGPCNASFRSSTNYPDRPDGGRPPVTPISSNTNPRAVNHIFRDPAHSRATQIPGCESQFQRSATHHLDVSPGGGSPPQRSRALHFRAYLWTPNDGRLQVHQRAMRSSRLRAPRAEPLARPMRPLRPESWWHQPAAPARCSLAQEWRCIPAGHPQRGSERVGKLYVRICSKNSISKNSVLKSGTDLGRSLLFITFIVDE